MVEGRLHEKVAIITGSSRGLGQYCAIEYAREGATVIVAARSEQDDPSLPGTIFETARLVEELGGKALPVVCNVADADSIDAMVAKVLKTYGRIDILMNNAGVHPGGTFSTIPFKRLDLSFKINVHGTFLCARAVLPTMIEQQRGSIINISSAAAQMGSPYGATKRAVEAFTEGLAEEQRENGIAVNALKPVGAIDTPGMRFLGRGLSPREKLAGLPGPEGYVEASVLLALQTPTTCTGRTFNDVQALEHFADPATAARFARARN
ncbi:MAG TPA: SDR family NAD(P)-dependent oxidoreductase [Acidimicrobiales bacterium]|nr:SDR family NAD(P)-dependent oxidoreductase [Acidimicrobiales bacterium]